MARYVSKFKIEWFGNLLAYYNNNKMVKHFQTFPLFPTCITWYGKKIWLPICNCLLIQCFAGYFPHTKNQIFTTWLYLLFPLFFQYQLTHWGFQFFMWLFVHYTALSLQVFKSYWLEYLNIHKHLIAIQLYLCLYILMQCWYGLNAVCSDLKNYWHFDSLLFL